MPTIKPLPPALDVRGTLTMCPIEPVRPCGKYVIQRVAPGLGNVPDVPRDNLQLRVHVVPFDPMTAPQLARRAIFAAGVAAWHAYTDEERDAWNEDAKPDQMSGFNRHMRRWLHFH